MRSVIGISAPGAVGRRRLVTTLAYGRRTLLRIVVGGIELS
jgi:hypothetical protein